MDRAIRAIGVNKHAILRQNMSKDSEQDFEGADESDTSPPRRGRAPTARERPFKLGPLGTLNQIIVALGKTIRAMADGTLDSQVGARICNGLGIMRACLETQKLEQLESRMDEIADRVARERTSAARARTSTHEAQRLSY
jgi:hypothetical protein